jgi:hypothetical protein
MRASILTLACVLLISGISIPGFCAGPDVIVGFVDNGREDSRIDGAALTPPRSGVFVGLTGSTNSCNAGDAALQWQEFPSVKHPVISLNLYRLADGRMEQIARSWVKHGFFATNRNACAGITGMLRQCPPATPGGNQLIPGCSDLYASDLNADPDNLGPRSKINPTTGNFDSTAKDLTGFPSSHPAERIMLVDQADLQRPGARFFLEAHYITADDAAAGNARNNTTYKEVKPTLLGGVWTLQNASEDIRRQPAITAWAQDGAKISEKETSESGRAKAFIFVASKSTALQGGTFRYDYAVYNMNSDLAIQSFSVPVGRTPPLNIENKEVESHGDIWSNDRWQHKVQDGRVTWSTRKFTDHQNANAIRWGTTYNFWLESGSAPLNAQATITLFKPTARPTLSMDITAPAK